MKDLFELKIELVIKDEETLETYAGINEQLIIDDFLNDPKAWLRLQGDVNVIKIFKERDAES